MPVSADELIQTLTTPIQKAMQEAGITPQLLAQKLSKELDAHETKFFQKDGFVISTRKVIAWGVRQTARMDAQKLLGAYPAEKHDLTVNPAVSFGEISPEKRALILAQDRMIQAEMEGKNGKRKTKGR